MRNDEARHEGLEQHAQALGQCPFVMQTELVVQAAQDALALVDRFEQ